MSDSKTNRIYSATYSNVPVYEYNVNGNHVMRRRSDDYINATHILKVADFDKPARTRILEREVQKGKHEKVQGGYGKYQGTWIPLDIGRDLAQKNGVYNKLAPIFEYIPGDRSPPPAPKHATATAGKPKAVRAPVQPKRQPTPQHKPQMSDASFDAYNQYGNEASSPRDGSIGTESDDELYDMSQYSTQSRKRKRGEEEPQILSPEERLHLIWSDELLDYFMLQNSNEALPKPPEPPDVVDLDRPVDEKGHTPMHWAAAMGDLSIVQDLQRRGSRVDLPSSNGETPLMRAVLFTNNFDKQTMGKMIRILGPTIEVRDYFGSNVFHHIAATTCSKSKYPVARYYLDTILNRLSETYNPQYIAQLLDQKDQNGDTPILLAARFGARKCVRSMIERGAALDIANKHGETADRVIEQLNLRRRDRYRQTSSSPMQQPNGAVGNGANTTTTNSQSQPNLGALSNIATYTPKPPHFQSEAASLLASQLPTLITSRAEALAAALEAELAEREAETQEAARLLEQRRSEVEALQRQSAALYAEEHQHANGGDDENDDAYDEAQQRELDALLRESEQLLEIEQGLQLASLMTHHSSDQAANNNNANNKAAGADDKAEDKLSLARAIAEQQSHRSTLLHDVITAQSLAGVGERCDLYKRLITGALGGLAEDVESKLPEMLSELREAREQGLVGVVDMDGDTAVGTPSALSGAASANKYARVGVAATAVATAGAGAGAATVQQAHRGNSSNGFYALPPPSSGTGTGAGGREAVQVAA